MTTTNLLIKLHSIDIGRVFRARSNISFVLRRKSDFRWTILSRLSCASLELTRASRGFRTAARAYVTSHPSAVSPPFVQ